MRRSLALSALVVVAAVAVDLGACSSFDDSHAEAAPDAGADAFVDGATTTPDAAAVDAPAATPKYVYVFGGVADAKSAESAKTAYRAPIQADGSLGAWEPFPAFDSGRDDAALAITQTGFVVFAGGHRTSPSGTRDYFVDSVDTASLEPTVKWAAGPPLPAGRSSPAAVAVGSRIYVSGGQTLGLDFHDEIWTATVESGALSPWAPAGTLPAPLATHAMVALGSRVYVFGGGGEIDGGLAYNPVAMMGTIDAEGAIGGWKESGKLPTQVNAAAAVTSGLRVFVIGGGEAPDAHPTAAVSVGTQAEDGTLVWTAGTPLPGPAWLPCAVVSGDTIYVTGGFPAAQRAPHAAVYVGRISSNGGIVWTTSAPMPVARGASGCAVR